MEIGIIIQARCDSGRFPKKILQKINGRSILWHVIERIKNIDVPVFVATTTRSIDESIIDIAKECNVKFFQGSTNDVLDRFYQTARKFSINNIIRITADCPLIDPNESKKVIKKLLEGNYDYVALDDSTYPDGLDTEGFTFDALEKCWTCAKLPSEREHVTPYIKNPQNNFKQYAIKFNKNYSQYRLTVDYSDDLDLIKKIYSQLYTGEIFYINDIIDLINKNPQLSEINSSHIRNEGYTKSLKNDKSTLN